MDGRDITTNVLPHTKHKFFVTARPEVRAERRLKELRARGNTQESFEQVLADIKLRDHNDSTRAYATAADGRCSADRYQRHDH